jgi:hypothetical protein
MTWAGRWNTKADNSTSSSTLTCARCGECEIAAGIVLRSRTQREEAAAEPSRPRELTPCFSCVDRVPCLSHTPYPSLLSPILLSNPSVFHLLSILPTLTLTYFISPRLSS